MDDINIETGNRRRGGPSYAFGETSLADDVRQIERRHCEQEAFAFMRKLPRASDQNKATLKEISTEHMCNICFTEFSTEI